MRISVSQRALLLVTVVLHLLRVVVMAEDVVAEATHYTKNHGVMGVLSDLIGLAAVVVVVQASMTLIDFFNDFARDHMVRLHQFVIWSCVCDKAYDLPLK